MSLKLGGSLKDKHLLLCFDAFGTLFRPREPIAATYARCARKFGIKNFDEDALAVSFKNAFKSVSEQFPNYGKDTGLLSDLWWARVIRESFEPITSTYVPDVMIRDLMKQYSSNGAYVLFRDVLPFFQYLKTTRFEQKFGTPPLEWPWKSTTIGIITNSDPRVSPILRSLGVGVHKKDESRQKRKDISFVTTSYQVGIEKPNAQIFQAALDAFTRLPSSTDIEDEHFVKVHVGDDMEKDVFGGMDAGWNTIFLDREGKYRDEWWTVGEEKRTLTITAEGRDVTAVKDIRGLEELWTSV